MIKEIKIGEFVYRNITKTENEDGKEVWVVPEKLDAFKQVAMDTINWQIGQKVKLALGDTQTSLSAANAKAVALLAKFLSPTKAQLATLTKKEKAAWDKLRLLADNGYADSDLLVGSLDAVLAYIQKGTDKAMRIAKAVDHDAVIEILNEDW